VDLRPVGPHDRDQLATFSCATAGYDFTLEVEQQIRESVVVELEAGRVEGLGSWDDDHLVAVITYSRSDWLWLVTVLATDNRYRRRKQAQRLKLEVLRRAREAGAEAVVSHVHRDNHPMLALNAKLGGVVTPAADPDNPYLVCTVPVRR
jgi:ribosomal protein S18 acetylase RimI-like enzyme